MDDVMLVGSDYTLVYNVLSFGTAVMFGAFVYFLTQMKSVSKQYQAGIAVSAIVVTPPTQQEPDRHKTNELM